MEQTDWVGGGVEWSVEMLARSCSCVPFAAGCSDLTEDDDGTGRGGAGRRKEIGGRDSLGRRQAGRHSLTGSPGIFSHRHGGTPLIIRLD